VSYYLKTDRGNPAEEIDDATGKKILDRGRHTGRRVDEVYVLHQDGHIDRYEEKTRRRLGSNAISSRTWLCQTYQPDASDRWGNDRYVPKPEEEIQEIEPAPEAVMLVLNGAEGDAERNVEQLTSLKANR
jgi:hypothetical protein